MKQAQIKEIIQRIIDTSLQAQKAGFDGLEVHSAHGYLLSQFLSPLTSSLCEKRSDVAT